MTIQPIETEYRGYRFRSRLEARWAVFFDQLGVQWEFEPQGFNTPHGPYLPDFLLPDVNPGGVWFEVKPDALDVADDDRWHDLATATERPVIVAYGMPAPDRVEPTRRDGDLVVVDAYGWDGWQQFCICPQCGRVGVQFEGRQGRICGHPDVEEEGAPGPAHPQILACYAAARSARFEHGESGPGVVRDALPETPLRPRMGPPPARLGDLLPGVVRDLAGRQSRGGAA